MAALRAKQGRIETMHYQKKVLAFSRGVLKVKREPGDIPEGEALPKSGSKRIKKDVFENDKKVSISEEKPSVRSKEMKKTIPELPQNVKDVFDDIPDLIRPKLYRLREIIYEVASHTPGVGPLEETLKWGDPSYVTSTTKSGSLVRINKRGKEGCAVYFHCQTSLVSTFRQLYPQLTYEGERAILLKAKEPIPEDILRDCVRRAFTYNLKKK